MLQQIRENNGKTGYLYFDSFTFYGDHGSYIQPSNRKRTNKNCWTGLFWIQIFKHQNISNKITTWWKKSCTSLQTLICIMSRPLWSTFDTKTFPKTPIDCTSDNSFEGAGNICKVGHTTTNQKHLEDVERPQHSQAKNTSLLINGRKCDMCWKCVCVCFKKTPAFEYVFSLHQKRVHLKGTHAIGPNFFHIIKSWDHECHEQIAIGISTFINSFWHLPFYQTSSPPFHEVQVMMSWHQG